MVAWLGSVLLAGGLIGALVLRWRPEGAPWWSPGTGRALRSDHLLGSEHILGSDHFLGWDHTLPWDLAWRSLGFALLLIGLLRSPVAGRAARWTTLACLLAALASFAASRVAAEHAFRPGIRAPIDAGRPSGPTAPIVGRWHPGPTVDPLAQPGCDLAHVGGIAWSVPRGHLADGDWVAFLSPPEETQFARGLVPGPRERRGARTRSPCPPGDVLRLARDTTPVVADLRATAAKLRARILARCDELRDPEARGLVAALLIGDVRRLPEGRGDLYVRTGTYHVLAVSGLQVALLAALCVLPLARMACFVLGLCLRWRPPAEPLALALLLVFTAIVGGGAPIVRATACFAFGLVAARLKCSRPALVAGTHARLPLAQDALASWWLALCLELALRPAAPLSLSVQLSFGATLGLVLGTRAASLAFLPFLRHEPDRLRQLQSPWRAFLDAIRVRVGKACATALGASLAATGATLPFLWDLQHEWAPIGIVATPAVFVPMLVLLVYGWAWILAPGLPEAPLAWSARALVDILRMADELPGSPSALPARPWWLVLLAVVLSFAFLRATRPAWRHCAGRGAFLLWAVLCLPWRARPARLEVHQLAVGHGSALIVRAPGSPTWIVDAGSRDRADVAREALAPTLAWFDDAHLALCATHEDADHMGALVWLAAHRAPVLHAGATNAALRAALPRSARLLDCSSGAQVLHHDARTGLELRLERGLERDGNEGSRTFVANHAGREVVVCGDAEAEGLEAWLERRAPRPVDLLVWPHHGADFLLGARLLEELAPAMAWFSSSQATPPAAYLCERTRPTATPWRSSAAGPLSWSAPSGDGLR
jgi:competence protein ComEC